MKHPFQASTGMYTDTESRLDLVKRLDAIGLRIVLAMPDLQKSVRLAAERRLRKLNNTKAEGRASRTLPRLVGGTMEDK